MLLPFHIARRHSLIGSVVILVIVMAYAVFADRPARIPKPIELAGTWIGFDDDELNFTRLDLRSDFNGYCARVSPADTVLHDYGVAGYRVTRWTLNNWNLKINLSPVTTNAEPIYLQGRYNGFSFQLLVGVTNGWHRKLVLFQESRIDAANQETTVKISQLEK